VRYLLSRRGYCVCAAGDATQALEIVRTLTPRLIFMDLQLPGMDGLELTQRIKAISTFSKTPIVALTAFAMKGDEERARLAGCDGYVTKPIDTHTLPGLVASFLERAAP